MNRKLATILSITLVLLVGGVASIPHVAQAAADCSWWLIFSQDSLAQCATISIFDSLFSQLGNWVLQFMSYAISLAGIILNASIVLTLNIKALYEATPAIEQTWIVIRNISSIFIIFALIYASINTILGTKGPQFGSLVVKIFFAGILINFSLFFTRILIDASNLVSLQFYRAIAPNSQNVDLSKGDIGTVLTNSFKQGGISDVFQQSLKIPKVYNKGGILATANGTFLVAVSTIGGSILMLTAALSFLFAGFAFIIRIVILLLIMGFSPLYFVGMIFPKVDQKMTSKFMDYFVPQLVFMPAYLFFMYVALKFLSNGGFFDALDTAQLAAAKAGSTIGAVVVADAGLIFQFIIAFVFINVPLVAALQLGGHGAGMANVAKDWVRGKVGGVVGRNTAGRLGKLAGKGFDNMAAAAQGSKTGRAATTVLRNLGISQAVRGGLTSVEKSKYGGKQSFGDVEREDKDRARVISGVQRERSRTEALKPILNNLPTTPEQLKTYYDAVGKMTKKELEDVPLKTLTNTQFAATLSSKQAEGLVDGDALSEIDKEKFKTARKEGLSLVFSSGQPTVIEKHMKNLSGKELSKVDPTHLQNNDVIDYMTPAQLKEMEDLIDAPTRRAIGNRISNLPPTTEHKAYGYMNDGRNRDRWTK